MRKCYLVLSAVLVLALLAGCQKTPDKAVVVGKGDGLLEQKILATASPTLPAAAPQGSAESSSSPAQLARDGERIQETLKNKAGNVELNIDAKIVRYDNQSFPAVTIVPQKFSQQQADSIIQALLGDLKLYSPTQLSREKINEAIISYKQKAEKATDKKKKMYETNIKKYESMLATAVPEADLDPASKKFMKATSIQYSESIVGKFQKNGHEYVLMIDNNEDGELSDVAMYKVGQEPITIMKRAGSDAADPLVKISYNQALQQAQQLVKDMQSDLSLEDSFVVESEPLSESGTGDKNYAYQFVFTREVNGVHVVYDTSVPVNDGTEEENNKNYQEPWPYECLTVTIDDKGVQDLTWRGPSKVEELLNDNVSMLPLSEIMNVFGQMIFIKNSAWETYIENNEDQAKAVIKVDRITLGLSRVQSQNKFYLIPVWDFYGSVDYVKADGTSLSGMKGDTEAFFRPALNSLLTVNAIDGSIIDRNLGY